MKDYADDVGFYYAVLLTVFFVNLQGLVLYILMALVVAALGFIVYLIFWKLGMCPQPGLTGGNDGHRENFTNLLERLMGVNKDTLGKKDLENLEKHMKKIDDFSLGELLKAGHEDCPIC